MADACGANRKYRTKIISEALMEAYFVFFLIGMFFFLIGMFVGAFGALLLITSDNK